MVKFSLRSLRKLHVPCPERRGELRTRGSPKTRVCPFQAETELPFHSYYFPCFLGKALFFYTTMGNGILHSLFCLPVAYTHPLSVCSPLGTARPRDMGSSCVREVLRLRKAPKNRVISFEFILRNTQMCFSPISPAKRLSVGNFCC